jgi:tRNA(fMet)-specific endonuclease VapC
MRKVLIDTSAYSRLLLGSPEVLQALESADLVYLPVFVLAELYFGFKGGSKEKQNRDLLARFLHRPTVRIIPATRETAEVFAEIKHALQRAGTPLPLHDVWTAAQAFETGSVLATFDAHFQKIAGLRLWDLLGL